MRGYCSGLDATPRSSIVIPVDSTFYFKTALALWDHRMKTKIKRLGSDLVVPVLAYVAATGIVVLVLMTILVLIGGVEGEMVVIGLAPLLVLISVPGALISSGLGLVVRPGRRLSVVAGLVSGLCPVLILVGLFLSAPASDQNGDPTPLGIFLFSYGFIVGWIYGWLLPRMRAGLKPRDVGSYRSGKEARSSTRSSGLRPVPPHVYGLPRRRRRTTATTTPDPQGPEVNPAG